MMAQVPFPVIGSVPRLALAAICHDPEYGCHKATPHGWLLVLIADPEQAAVKLTLVPIATFVAPEQSFSVHIPVKYGNVPVGVLEPVSVREVAEPTDEIVNVAPLILIACPFHALPVVNCVPDTQVTALVPAVLTVPVPATPVGVA